MYGLDQELRMLQLEGIVGELNEYTKGIVSATRGQQRDLNFLLFGMPVLVFDRLVHPHPGDNIVPRALERTQTVSEVAHLQTLSQQLRDKVFHPGHSVPRIN